MMDISFSFQSARDQLLSLNPKLLKISQIEENLRESVSPDDIKNFVQQAKSLKQQQADLDHRLFMMCNDFEDQLEMLPLFTERYNQFMKWADDLEGRITNKQNEREESNNLKVN